MTWMTEERSGAPATGAPTAIGCVLGATAGCTDLQIQKRAGLVPAAHGPGLVGRSSAVAFFHINDHVAPGRTAWNGTPLGSSGAGFG